MTALAVPFAQALATYPAFVQDRAKHLGLTTTTQLWILGDGMEWSDHALADGDPSKMPPADAMDLYRANWALAQKDDLPDLLSEFSFRIGFPVSVGDELAWDRTDAWSRNFGDRAPQGRLVARGGGFPHMAMPLGILVAPMQMFPAWTLTRKTGVRRLA